MFVTTVRLSGLRVRGRDPRMLHIGEKAMNDEIEKAVAEPVRQTDRTSGQRRRVAVADILADQREAILEHNGQDYLLRITANGRLILTK